MEILVTLIAGILLLAIPAVFGLVFFLIIKAFISGSKASKVFQAYTATTGLTYVPKDSTGYKGVVTGTISDKARGQDPTTGKLTELFYLSRVEGSGKNRHTVLHTIASVQLKGAKANVFINSQLNDAQSLPKLDPSQRYTAEGDFGKYFDIYFPTGQQVPSLSLFAPDVLSLLMAEYGYYDVEVVDDILYVYAYYRMNKPEELEKLRSLAVKLAIAIDTNSPKSIGLGLAPQTAMPRLNNQKLSWKAALIVLGVVIFHYITSFGEFSGSIPPYTSYILFAVVAILTIIGLIRRQRQKDNYELDRKAHQTNTPNK